MRLDSCRKCGTELEIANKCRTCGEANKFFCHHCSNITDEQIHATCLHVSLDQSLPKTTVA